MVYARVASGYRPGGPNSTPALGSFKPDTTQNYEIGIKGNVLDHALSFDASLYYIDWKDIQLTLIDRSNGFGYYANASRAKSQGVELSAESRPLRGLTITAWGAWNDAVLTAAFPTTSSVYGAAGDRLPYSSRFSGAVWLEQQYSLTSSVTGFVGASESYVGYHEGIFTGSAQRQHLPAYAKTDVRAGVRYESWTANCFVTNVSDKRGLFNGGLGTVNPLAFHYIQPRTVGLLLAKTF
jgi:iron complex outermembrane recepter protein